MILVWFDWRFTFVCSSDIFHNSWIVDLKGLKQQHRKANRILMSEIMFDSIESTFGSMKKSWKIDEIKHENMFDHQLQSKFEMKFVRLFDVKRIFCEFNRICFVLRYFFDKWDENCTVIHHLYRKTTSDHVLFKKKRVKDKKKWNLVCKIEENVVEWPVKNYSVITERDQNFPK